MLTLDIAGAQIDGARDYQEDAFLITRLSVSSDRDGGTLCIVADGMGGHAAGDVASRLCVETIQRELLTDEDDSARQVDDLERQMRSAINKASQAIQEEARRKPFLYGMGTTVVMLRVEDGRAFLAHAGDSRAYLIREDGLERLTSDHTWVNEQVQAGLLTEEEGEISQYKNLLTRSVGFETRVQSDTSTRPIQAGDHYLLCSDGLTNVVRDQEIADLILGRDDPAAAARALVELARERGAPDNVTAVLLYVAD